MKPNLYHNIVLLISLFFSFDLQADVTIPGDGFRPAQSGCEILWSGDVEQLPESLPNYSAKAHRFSRKTINYFKTLGGLSDKFKVPPLEHWGVSKEHERYDDDTTSLSVAPNSGSLQYYCIQSHEKYSLVDAPAPEVAKEMTIKILKDLDLQLPAISFDKARFTTETSTRFNRALGKPVTRPCGVRMFVPRLYEGYPSNEGGITAQYGYGGEIIEFAICWREVELAGRRKVPSRDEIAKQIQEGRVTMMMDAAQNANKLTIKKISIIYREAAMFRKDDTVEPILFINADADVGGIISDCTIYLKL